MGVGRRGCFLVLFLFLVGLVRVFVVILICNLFFFSIGLGSVIVVWLVYLKDGELVIFLCGC